ncbi:hypothetical protein Q7V44_01595 [Streptococcus suis]|nr:hypothetical protein [Streptococcus suis]
MKLRKVSFILVTFVIVLLSLSSVKAETSMFVPVGQQNVPGVKVAPFRTGSDSIHVHVGSFGYVTAYINGKKIDVPTVKPKSKCPKEGEVNYFPQCYEREWEVSGHRADGSGDYVVKLNKKLEEGDVVTLKFADDGNLYFGQLVYKSEKKRVEQNQKEQEDEYADALFKRSIEEEENKTWRDRIKDTFQDTWWNFKGRWNS